MLTHAHSIIAIRAAGFHAVADAVSKNVFLNTADIADLPKPIADAVKAYWPETIVDNVMFNLLHAVAVDDKLTITGFIGNLSPTRAAVRLLDSQEDAPWSEELATDILLWSEVVSMLAVELDAARVLEQPFETAA